MMFWRRNPKTETTLAEEASEVLKYVPGEHAIVKLKDGRKIGVLIENKKVILYRHWGRLSAFFESQVLATWHLDHVHASSAAPDRDNPGAWKDLVLTIIVRNVQRVSTSNDLARLSTIGLFDPIEEALEYLEAAPMAK